MKSLDAIRSLNSAYTKLFNRCLNRPLDTIVKWEEIDIITKDLVALKMIKEKLVDVEWLYHCCKYEDNPREEYNKRCLDTLACPLNEGDFDFLKERLIDED